MGQQNDSLEPETVLNQINSIEQKLKKDNIFSEESFNIAKAVAVEYKNCKTLLDIYQTKKNLKEKMDKNKYDEINHNFERITKWIKMAKTPYVSNFQFFLGKIKGDDKKIKNKKLYQDKSTDNIFNKGNKKKRTKLNLNQDFPQTDRKVRNNEENIHIKKNKRKQTTSLDKYKQKISDSEINKEEEDKNNNVIIQNFSDKNIEEKIREFYSYNKSKFKERLFKEPPECLRWVSWCIINQTPLERDINIYNNYLVKDLEEENKNCIIRDIQRTFSDTNINKDELKKKEISLYNVLKAFWNLDDQIGYCQGMNLLVGFMLLISEGNELDTFYILISNFSATFNQRKVYDYSWRGLFSEGFPLLVYLNFIFDILLEENLPEIKNHLDELGITYDLWIGQWFQTLFTIVLPINWCKRVWDCIFSDSIYFLIKFGIVFTKLLKNDILEKTEEIDVINFFKDLQKYSMCSENKFLEQKGDINILVTNANKIKIDPEQYIKLYRKRNEDFNEFKIEMDKNSGVLYPLESGNRAWNDFKINNRATVLFEKEEKDDKESISLNQIENLYGEEKKEKKEKKEMVGKHIKRSEKLNNNNVIYDPNTKKIEIKINNKNQINKNKIDEEKEIKIKPILEKKDRININNFEINKNINIKENKIFDDNNNININKNEELNNNKNNINEININNHQKGVYKKKKTDKIQIKKANKITESRINMDYSNNTNNANNNIINNYQINNNNINNINNNMNYTPNNIYNNVIPNQNNYNSIYNDYTNKYYNVNLADDNSNLDNYYKNKLKK